MYLNMLIPAVIGIVSFSLAILNNYYQTPMVIIGKVYANSMLVLVNSRMLLGSESEEVPLTDISVMRFDAAPATTKDSAVEKHDGDLAARAGFSASSESEK